MTRTLRHLAAATLCFAAIAAAARAEEPCWVERAATAVADTATTAWDGAVDWGDRTLDAAADAIDDAYAALTAYPVGLRLYEPVDGDNAWVEPPNAAAPLPERVVLLIHGLDEPGAIWRNVAPALAAEGHAVVRFDYPNDQAIADSAELLQTALVDLRALGAQRVTIVAHSMGGLVARDALTRSDAPEDAAAVDRLITIGTPNQGAPLAGLRWMTETRELFATTFSPPDHRPRAPLSILTDGDGDAGRDLKPGSAFLADLNARPLPDDVRMTIIAGVWAEPDAAEIADSLASTVRWIPGSERVLPEARFEALAGALDAAARELGDGVVPLDSTPLEGVSDYLILRGNHRSLLRDENAPAIEVILSRLDADPQPAE